MNIITLILLENVQNNLLLNNSSNIIDISKSFNNWVKLKKPLNFVKVNVPKTEIMPYTGYIVIVVNTQFTNMDTQFCGITETVVDICQCYVN